VVIGVPGVGKSLGLPGVTRLIAGPAADVITYHVKPANLPVTVTERGNLESSKNEDVYCKVEGQTTIIMILPEGSPVKKGQLVVELDSSSLKDQLTNQVIATKGAEAAYLNAKLTREVAEIAVIEYVEGIFKQDEQTVRGEIALADSNLKRAQDRLEWSNRMMDKKYLSVAQNMSDRLALDQSKFNFEQSLTKKKVLMEYTKDKTVKELKAEVEKARSDELAKEQTWQLEKDKEAKLRRQIDNCKLVAPNDGLVVYANDPGRNFGSNQPQIEEGATVRERQKIFSLPDITKMQVNTKVHESMVDRIRPDLRARIKVDAFADQVLTGTVLDVAPLPDPTNFFSSDIKVYATKVSIDKGLSGLRPGMTAQVEILVTELPNVLSVPVQAVLEYDNKDHIAVKSLSGHNGFEWREVTLGISNDKLVEIKKGLSAGDVVALNPIALMSEEEKREAFGAASKDATKKDWGSAPAKVGLGPEASKGPATPAAAPGEPGKAVAGPAAGTGKAAAKGKGQRKGGGAFGKMDAAAKTKFMSASPEEQRKMLEANGVPPDRVDMILERMKSGGGFGPPGGGGGGFGPPGGGGGGFGPPGGGGGGFGGPGGGGAGRGGFNGGGAPGGTGPGGASQ
jgi:multidrug efflux pump subunit AcrA (membrane-fusion protein)